MSFANYSGRKFAFSIIEYYTTYLVLMIIFLQQLIIIIKADQADKSIRKIHTRTERQEHMGNITTKEPNCNFKMSIYSHIYWQKNSNNNSNSSNNNNNQTS